MAVCNTHYTTSRWVVELEGEYDATSNECNLLKTAKSKLLLLLFTLMG